MSRPFLGSLGAIVATGAARSIPTTPVAGQSPTPGAAAPGAGAAGWTPARTPWGAPDLAGVYSNSDEGGIPFERPAEFEGRRLEDISGQELRIGSI
jgi:hypothetical protein